MRLLICLFRIWSLTIGICKKMINKEIKTLNELRRAKSAYNFAKYYDLDNAELNYIYDFIADSNNKVVGNDKGLFFYVSDKLVKQINKSLASEFAGNVSSVSISDDGFYVVPIVTSSSYSSYSSDNSSSYSGGGSSNNNNNNNNNG